MKFRKLLMTGAFLLAVASTFAFKPQTKGFMYFSWILDGTCYVQAGSTDQQYCQDYYTGAQCTFSGIPIYKYDVLGGPVPPTCSVPLRRL
ncbi:hypothetical protein HQN86_24965 [Pedobacter panaciterrae]|uniref:hypothetical protein n=1 Tax=Pedobacter panaciterrae TaxID=363849 RepID=UPI00155DD8D4|nr:hypothetical protein [Pedobacter panaciterrae]NQX56893.1 hypothetical protein [Pedobacter panaciterrae]